MDYLPTSSNALDSPVPNPAIVAAVEAITSYTFMEVFPDNEAAVIAAVELGLIPSRDVTPPPPCPKCQGSMSCHKSAANQAGYVYRCKETNVTLPLTTSDGKRRRLTRRCTGYMSPLGNTFFL